MKKKFHDSKYYEDWMLKARRDLATAYLNHRHGGYTDTTCYFCHQTVEKALKAYLLAEGLNILPKTHILPSLLSMCFNKDKRFQEFEDDCGILNEYFIETKYPSDPPIDYPKEEADKALESAEEVLNFVVKKIKRKFDKTIG